MNEKIQKCYTCYYDDNCYWQELADPYTYGLQ